MLYNNFLMELDFYLQIYAFRAICEQIAMINFSSGHTALWITPNLLSVFLSENNSC